MWTLTSVISHLYSYKAEISYFISRGVWLAKNDFGSVFGSVLVLLNGPRFWFFGSVFCIVCCLCMTLEMTYFCAELVQLIVSGRDSELEVQDMA